MFLVITRQHLSHSHHIFMILHFTYLGTLNSYLTIRLNFSTKGIKPSMLVLSCTYDQLRDLLYDMTKSSINPHTTRKEKRKYLDAQNFSKSLCLHLNHLYVMFSKYASQMDIRIYKTYSID